jgi:hypothetical protein
VLTLVIPTWPPPLRAHRLTIPPAPARPASRFRQDPIRRFACQRPELLNLTKRVKDLLQITKLYTVFDVHDNEVHALRSFSPAAATA